MGTGVSGEDTELAVSGLGSDAKTLSPGLLLTVIAEGVSLFVKGIEGVTGVLILKIGHAGTELTFSFTICFRAFHPG